MTKQYKIEFHWRNGPEGSLGSDTVDEGASFSEVRQVMANWYSSMEAHYVANQHWHEEDYAEEVEHAASISHLFLAGEFFVRDSRGNVIERVDAAVVRASPEIATADTLWKERRDPDYERKQAEELERQRQERLRYWASPEYQLAKDRPF